MYGDELDFYTKMYNEIERLRKEGVVEYVTSYDRFREIIENHPVVVAVFTTPTCSACMIYKPIFYMVAEKLRDKAKWIEVDAYEAPEAAFESGVTATPTTIVYVDGEAVDGFVGILDEEGLVEIVKQYVEEQS
ncbi:Thioredoxin [Pyrodictium delaneyi]|uniref:Thioredoxin n=1 Tax=Pyrodictium delaneyi TaxID=1273541 RepID=A0A0P0N2C5_9CREN|nr:thioredoxin family protein [Pyrodictium delaneyi]ALL01037.1 Thioredoxin [Pyrodictium delaneyi]OWJ55369.1 thioredoxin [Pyrodictium delaneyi]